MSWILRCSVDGECIRDWEISSFMQFGTRQSFFFMCKYIRFVLCYMWGALKECFSAFHVISIFASVVTYIIQLLYLSLNVFYEGLHSIREDITLPCRSHGFMVHIAFRSWTTVSSFLCLMESAFRDPILHTCYQDGLKVDI